MLTDSEILDLRKGVVTAHIGRRFTQPVARIRYIDGRLAGVESIIERSALTVWSLGWCQLTRTDPVQVMYQPGAVPGEFTFRSFEAVRN